MTTNSTRAPLAFEQKAEPYPGRKADRCGPVILCACPPTFPIRVLAFAAHGFGNGPSTRPRRARGVDTARSFQ